MKLKFSYKGGTGSGHHGHAGRPGKVGGSVPGHVAQQGVNTLPGSGFRENWEKERIDILSAMTKF